MPGKYLRPGSYSPPGTDLAYKGAIHYPAVYNGSFNWGNPKENLVQEMIVLNRISVSRMKGILIVLCQLVIE